MKTMPPLRATAFSARHDGQQVFLQHGEDVDVFFGGRHLCTIIKQDLTTGNKNTCHDANAHDQVRQADPAKHSPVAVHRHILGMKGEVPPCHARESKIMLKIAVQRLVEPWEDTDAVAFKALLGRAMHEVARRLVR
jgi:hypothetical protein